MAPADQARRAFLDHIAKCPVCQQASGRRTACDEGRRLDEAAVRAAQLPADADLQTALKEVRRAVAAEALEHQRKLGAQTEGDR